MSICQRIWKITMIEVHRIFERKQEIGQSKAKSFNISMLISDTFCTCMTIGLVLWCLTPLWTIFECYWWRTPEYLQKITDMPQVTDKLYHIIMLCQVHLAISWFRTRNISGDCIGSCKSNTVTTRKVPVIYDNRSISTYTCVFKKDYRLNVHLYLNMEIHMKFKNYSVIRLFWKFYTRHFFLFIIIFHLQKTRNVCITKYARLYKTILLSKILFIVTVTLTFDLMTPK